MPRLEGKVALITGGGGGIGAATARLFCAEGAAVMLVDFNGDGLAKTAAAIRKEIPDARLLTFTADVSDDAQAMEAVRRTLNALDGIDVLVNNAAMRNYTAIFETTP